MDLNFFSKCIILYILNQGVKKMASKRMQIKLKSEASPHCRSTYKNKSNTPDRIELMKYDPVVRKRVKYKETK